MVSVATRVAGKTEYSVISPTQAELVRIFDAPRDLLWQAYTRPEHIVNWWGSANGTTVVEQQDCRPGGTWRYVMRRGDRSEAAFGTFLEVVAPERLVYTVSFDRSPGRVVTDVLNFYELGRQTRMVATANFTEAGDLEELVESLAARANAMWSRLDEVLASLR